MREATAQELEELREAILSKERDEVIAELGDVLWCVESWELVEGRPVRVPYIIPCPVDKNGQNKTQLDQHSTVVSLFDQWLTEWNVEGGFPCNFNPVDIDPPPHIDVNPTDPDPDPRAACGDSDNIHAPGQGVPDQLDMASRPHAVSSSPVGCYNESIEGEETDRTSVACLVLETRETAAPSTPRTSSTNGLNGDGPAVGTQPPAIGSDSNQLFTVK